MRRKRLFCKPNNRILAPSFLKYKDKKKWAKKVISKQNYLSETQKLYPVVETTLLIFPLKNILFLFIF